RERVVSRDRARPGNEARRAPGGDAHDAPTGEERKHAVVAGMVSRRRVHRGWWPRPSLEEAGQTGEARDAACAPGSPLMRHLLDEAPEALDGFARLPRALLVLDFDGTIAPFAPTPEAARLEPTAATALERLLGAASGLRVGVASGRSIQDLRRRLP